MKAFNYLFFGQEDEFGVINNNSNNMEGILEFEIYMNDGKREKYLIKKT